MPSKRRCPLNIAVEVACLQNWNQKPQRLILRLVLTFRKVVRYYSQAHMFAKCHLTACVTHCTIVILHNSPPHLIFESKIQILDGATYFAQIVRMFAAVCLPYWLTFQCHLLVRISCSFL